MPPKKKKSGGKKGKKSGGGKSRSGSPSKGMGDVTNKEYFYVQIKDLEYRLER